VSNPRHCLGEVFLAAPIAVAGPGPPDCRHAQATADCRPRFDAADVPVLTLFFLVVLVVALGTAWWVLRRARRHRDALLRLLDAADAFEARLRTARAEIEAATGAEDETVRTALQEMLRQRLWLQEYGETASSQRLDEMRASMDAARQRIDQQLSVIERARTAAP